MDRYQFIYGRDEHWIVDTAMDSANPLKRMSGSALSSGPRTARAMHVASSMHSTQRSKDEQAISTTRDRQSGRTR